MTFDLACQENCLSLNTVVPTLLAVTGANYVVACRWYTM